jgi:BlaI family transcriptional regulator, penicillinase repressor
MAKSPPTLGELELRVLQLVWERQPCTERTISELVLAERDVARTTVLKTMQRLEAKRLLVRVDRQRLLPDLIRKFVDHVLGGSAEPLVAYLADSEKLSAKDLETLRSIARKIGAGDESASRK